MRIYSVEEKEESLKRKDLSFLTNMIVDGVDVNSLVIPHHTDVLLVALNKKNKTLFKTVLEKGFKCNRENNFLYVHHSIRTNDVFFVKKIIEKYIEDGINFNEYSKEKENCLHIACSDKILNEEIIIYLSQLKIKWSEKNLYGETPLHILRKSPEKISPNLLSFFENKKLEFKNMLAEKNSVNSETETIINIIDIVDLTSFLIDTSLEIISPTVETTIDCFVSLIDFVGDI